MQKLLESTMKKETYTFEMRNFNKAIKYGFYLEAISISYAAAEDRLNTFLFYAGLISINIDKGKFRIVDRVRKFYRYLLNGTKQINNISTKINLVKSLLLFSQTYDGDYLEFGTKKNANHLKDLMQSVKKLNIELLISKLDELNNIIKTRNLLTHALFNRKQEETLKLKEDCALRLIQVFRDLDKKLVKPIKNKEFRKNYNVQ